MVLVCDLGNTNFVFAFFENDECIMSFRLVSSNLMGKDEYVAKLNNIILDKKIDISKISGAIMSSVMPSISKIIKDAIEEVFAIETLVFGPGVKSGMAIKTDNPSEVGTDLVAACIGALDKYSAPLLIVDLGTATKINVVDKNNNFIGCTIQVQDKIFIKIWIRICCIK